LACANLLTKVPALLDALDQTRWHLNGQCLAQFVFKYRTPAGELPATQTRPLMLHSRKIPSAGHRKPSAAKIQTIHAITLFEPSRRPSLKLSRNRLRAQKIRVIAAAGLMPSNAAMSSLPKPPITCNTNATLSSGASAASARLNANVSVLVS
jgi:hypothetical protein